MLTAFAMAALVLFWLYLIGTAALREILTAVRGRQRPHGGLGARLTSKPFLRLLHAAERMDIVRLRVEKLHRQLMLLQGSGWSMEQTKAGLAHSLALAYAMFTAGVCLSMLANEPALAAMGGVVAAVVVLRRFAEAGRAVERRRRAIIAALPDMIAKLMLLVGAGDPVQSAFAKCWSGRQTSRDNALHKEWKFAMTSMANGQSFGAAIERMNRNCGVQEVSVFATVLLLNYRRGGDQFVLALREFSYSIWEKRKAAARTSGEEASSKLVFPLVGILFIMMVIVAAPALLFMS